MLFRSDPAAWLCFVEGPLHGQVRRSTICNCRHCEAGGGHGDTWPVQIRPFLGDDDEELAAGTYVLAWIWCPDGAPLEEFAEDESGTFYLPSAFEEPEE